MTALDPPAKLDEAAKEEWRRLAPALAAKGLMEGTADVAILTDYCNAFALLCSEQQKTLV